MSLPRYRMRPDDVANRPAIILPVVVLPHPDSPTRHNTSPAGIVRLTSSTALIVRPLTMNVRDTCSRMINGSDMRYPDADCVVTRSIECDLELASTLRLERLQC